MSTIEERLARDIAAVTGGVVVTESDLRDARDAVDELIISRRQRDRRTVLAAAAAAVLVLVLGVTAFLNRGADDQTAPPAHTGRTTSDPDADFLVGRAPSPDLLQGVWRLDNGGAQMRFSAPNLFSYDTRGQLFRDPAVYGTYVIDGDLVTLSVDGGPAGCGGQELVMRASAPEPPVGPGALRLVHTRPGTGRCGPWPPQDARWVMEQVLPASQYMTGLVFSAETGWQPLVGKSALHGLWMAEGGGYGLEIDPGGSYYVADESGEPVDRGQWSLRGQDLSLTSSADSIECSKGDRLVLGAVEQVDPGGTRALRSTVQENTCDAPWVPAAWILIPHEGS
jgi:hypothetical protein